MAQQDHQARTVRRRSPQGAALAFLAALVANALLFYVLAAARARPSLVPESRAEVVALSVMDLPLPDSEAPDIEPPEIDIMPIVSQDTPIAEAQAIPETATMLTPRLPDGVRAIGAELPGLAVALPGPADLRLVPGVSTTAVQSPLSLSGVDRPPRRLSGAPPRVPGWARRARLEGKVTLRFIVTLEGRVTDVNIRRIEGDERFGREASRALATWRFEPARRRGEPVACWCIKTINFTLSD